MFGNVVVIFVIGFDRSYYLIRGLGDVYLDLVVLIGYDVFFLCIDLFFLE